MRKVYHQERSLLGLVVAFICSLCLTVLLFGSLPFAHRIGNPTRTLELRKTTTAELEQEIEETVEAETPPEAEAPPEALQNLDLTDTTAQPIPLNPSLDVAVGSGGGLAGFGDLGSVATVQSAQEDIFDVSDLEKRPEPISQVSPVYPPELLRAKVEGAVTLLFVLNEEGQVEDARVEASSRTEFEKPALDAVRKWRFRPGMKDNQPVRTYIRAPLKFRLPSG